MRANGVAERKRNCKAGEREISLVCARGREEERNRRELPHTRLELVYTHTKSIKSTAHLQTYLNAFESSLRALSSVLSTDISFTHFLRHLLYKITLTNWPTLVSLRRVYFKSICKLPFVRYIGTKSSLSTETRERAP